MPRISIGMPVYNGSLYIENAIDSILAQTYRDFELIICDNASTDDTKEICLRYVNTDPRVKYFCNEKNIGAGPNFNLVVEFCSGEYFKWAAHDDICHPEFLERCIESLDKDPGVVLAFPQAHIIDENSKLIEPDVANQRTDSSDPAVRLKDLSKGHRCFQVFGLIRMSELKKTPMIGLYPRGDAVLLYWLALKGRFEKIDKELFYPRRHGLQSMSLLADKKKKRKTDYLAYSEWFDPSAKKRFVFPRWRVAWELARCVVIAPISVVTRVRCVPVIITWMFRCRLALLREVFVPLLQLSGVRSRSTSDFVVV